MTAVWGLSLLVGFSLVSFCSATKTYVVSPSGSFPTGQPTWIQSTSLTATLAQTKEGDTVYLCDGEVFTGGPFAVTKKSSTIQSYACNPANAGTKPLLTISTIFSGTPTVDAASGQWTYDLSSYSSEFDAPASLVALWINGVRYHPARYPNVISPTNLLGASTSEFIYAKPWTAASYAQVTALTPASPLKNTNNNYWVGSTLRIRETDWGYASPRNVVSVANGVLTMDSAFSNPNQISGSGFYIESSNIGELDAPGEYFFDPATYKLHVLPISGHTPSSQMVFLPQQAAIFSASNTHGSTMPITGGHSVVNGIAFRYGYCGIDSAGPSALSNVDVRDMVNLGVDGNVQLTNSYISDVINIGANLMPGGYQLQVQGTTFNNIGVWAGYVNQPTGVMCFDTCYVEGNTFTNMGYAAVYPNKPYSVVSGNSITNAMAALADGGAIYYGSVSGNIFTGNTITTIVGNTISGASTHRDIISSGFYLDTFAYNATISGNTIITNYGPSPDLRQSCIKMDNTNVITNNICVGGKIDVTLTGSAVLSGVVIDDNVFMPTPGTPGQTTPILIRFDSPSLAAPYLPTKTTFHSISGNTFCLTQPTVTAAAWNPIFVGNPPVTTAGDLGVSHFVDVSTNQKDTSGKCFSKTVPVSSRGGVASLASQPTGSKHVLRNLVRNAVRKAFINLISEPYLAGQGRNVVSR